MTELFTELDADHNGARDALVVRANGLRFLRRDQQGILDIPLTADKVKKKALEEVGPHFERVTEVSSNGTNTFSLQQVRKETEAKFRQSSPEQEVRHLMIELYSNINVNIFNYNFKGI